MTAAGVGPRVLGTLAAVLALARPALAGGQGRGERAPAPIKVVYHLTGGLDEAMRGLHNARNHLKAEPGVKIVIVANGAGIDFLLDGATDRNGNPFDAIVQDLAAQGVEFRVCRNTLETRHLDPSKVMPEAKIVPSGVAEVARLQAREGFVYVRP